VVRGETVEEPTEEEYDDEEGEDTHEKEKEEKKRTTNSLVEKLAEIQDGSQSVDLVLPNDDEHHAIPNM
jgi:hypothetical protein